MSVYFIKGKGWRYDFTLKAIRHTEAWFKTKTEAKQAEAKRREEIANPKLEPQPETQKTPTDMAFLELVNRRLDYVKAYDSNDYYCSYSYMARRWIKKWGALLCSQITQDMAQDHILARSSISAYTANKDLRCLRAVFNFGLERDLITVNPTKGIEFLPVEKKIKSVPSVEDIDKVIEVAAPDVQDYLWTIRETMARVNEINRLTWDDVSFEKKYVVLYTRKKKGGHLTPRKVPMTQKLFSILSRRYSERDKAKPWVFWHRYWSRMEKEFKEGPFQDRKRIMKSLCKRARVKYFRFHPLRHSGASIMDENNVPMGAIQRILGHENRSTTEIYLHSISHAERDAIFVYEQARQKSHTNSHTPDTK
ncbi:MAG TPA: site-specific integrase [Desulfatiglandales bacterium]|nr:site-specific integrase [Desulfatiglandales bacterium]